MKLADLELSNYRTSSWTCTFFSFLLFASLSFFLSRDRQLSTSAVPTGHRCNTSHTSSLRCSMCRADPALKLINLNTKLPASLNAAFIISNVSSIGNWEWNILARLLFFAPTRFRTALATCQRAHKNAFSLIASTWNLHRSFVDCDVLWTLRRCNRDMIYSSKAKLIANDRFNCCAGCERAFNNKTFFAIYILRQAVNHGAGSW